MVETHVLFSGYLTARGAYRLPVIFRSVHTVRIKPGSNPWETKKSVSELRVYL